jgi:hypothetical protein
MSRKSYICFLLGIFLAASLISACSSIVVEYPSVCINEDAECQRNLNAETLSNIGEQGAALELLKTDPTMSDVLTEPDTIE